MSKHNRFMTIAARAIAALAVGLMGSGVTQAATHAPNAPAAEPDLAVFNFEWQPISPTTSDLIEAKITIKNLGKGDFIGGKFYLDFYVDHSFGGCGDAASRKSWQLADPILAGATQQFTYTLTETLSAGVHPFTTFVDSTCALSETDEANNVVTMQPIITKPVQSSGRIAYVFNGEASAATSYKTLLEGRGYTVDLIALNAVTRTALSDYQLFIMADDSGRYPGDTEWFTWGTSQANTTAQMAPIIAANKPVIGLGEGGSIYLEKRGLSIGWLSSWYRTGDVDTQRPVPLMAGAVYASPNAIPPDPVVAYASNRAALAVNLPRLSAQAFPIGIEIPDKAHANIAGEACHFLWGFRDGPTSMTGDGKNLFHNLVEYAIHFQCSPPRPPPPQTCIAISKSANPVNGSRVTVSDIGAGRISLITYTLSYTLSNSPNCNNTDARIYDYIPEGTEFLPGSATDGVTPDPSRAMIWVVTPGSSGSKQFTVVLLDAACSLNETIHNRAKIAMAGLPDSIQSNEVKHEQVCPPVHGDNRNPAFAQDELQVYPYPIVAGRQHTVSLRLINRTITNTTVTVRLQNSANAFGIGIPFTSFATRTVSIPALGNIIVEVPATFARTGHYCVCVEIDIPGYGTIRSCRNLDVMEDLRPGIPDTLTFAVGNPTPFTTDVMLDVDNTCPGFTAVVSPSILTGMAPGEVRQAQLVTTPPNPVTLGSGCHIDVRGYTKLGGRWQPMNEGIRKLDVPPVQIRHPEGIAPWLSPYISFREEPVRAGVPNSICIELQNPLDITKTVTLVYHVAQFGAGIGFTPIATRTVELPPHSIAKYCVDWTPATADHYCVLVRVLQPGFLPQEAQRNVDVISSPWRPELTVPVLIGNLDLISHTLRLQARQWGIDPFYEPYLRFPRPGGGGDPAPDVIGPGQQLQLELAFRPRAFADVVAMMPMAFNAPQPNPLKPLATPTFGDVQRVDVAVSMDGKDVSGFSAQFVAGMKMIFLPMIVRQ